MSASDDSSPEAACPLSASFRSFERMCSNGDSWHIPLLAVLSPEIDPSSTCRSLVGSITVQFRYALAELPRLTPEADSLFALTILSGTT